MALQILMGNTTYSSVGGLPVQETPDILCTSGRLNPQVDSWFRAIADKLCIHQMAKGRFCLDLGPADSQWSNKEGDDGPVASSQIWLCPICILAQKRWQADVSVPGLKLACHSISFIPPVSFHNPDLLLRQSVQLVDQRLYLPVRWPRSDWASLCIQASCLVQSGIGLVSAPEQLEDIVFLISSFQIFWI